MTEEQKDAPNLTPEQADGTGADELVARLRAFDAARAAFASAVAEYNERLAYEKKIAALPRRMGDLYEKMEDAKRNWFVVAQDLADENKGSQAADLIIAVQAEIAAKDARIAELERLDREAATHVEAVICTRTDFTGEPPYVGWKGIGLALTEALDERDRLRAEIAAKDARVSELEALDIYAAAEGYTDSNGEPLREGDELHPGMLAKLTAEEIRAAIKTEG